MTLLHKSLSKLAEKWRNLSNPGQPMITVVLEKLILFRGELSIKAMFLKGLYLPFFCKEKKTSTSEVKVEKIKHNGINYIHKLYTNEV